MGKFARKPPPSVRSVVEAGKNHAEAWYSKPINLGRLDLRNGYWYTQDGKRFISSRDAMDYLITVYEMVGPGKVLPLEPRSIDITTDDEPASPRSKKKQAAPPPPKKQKSTKPQQPSAENLVRDLLKRPDILAMLTKEVSQKKE